MRKKKTWKKWTLNEIIWLKENSYKFTISELSLILNRTQHSIRNILKILNLKYKKCYLGYEESKNELNKIIEETPHDFWYIIGFIATDGCVHKKRKMVTITQKERDILNKIDIIFKGRCLLRETNRYALWKLVINNLYFRDWLIDYGIVPNKSRTLKLKKPIPKEYQADFIRGVFDGDGCVGIYVKDKIWNYSFDCSIFNCSKFFVNDIYEIFINNKLYPKIYKAKKKCYKISFTNRENILKLYEWIYSTPSFLYIERKKNNFEELLKHLYRNVKEVEI